jgi:hypothetical protein
MAFLVPLVLLDKRVIEEWRVCLVFLEDQVSRVTQAGTVVKDPEA